MAKGEVERWEKCMKIWKDYMDKWRVKMDEWKIRADKRLVDHGSRMLTFQEVLRETREDMYTRQDHHEFMVTIDAFAQEIEESRREREILGYRYVEMGDQIANHEKRLTRLEDGKI